MKATLCGLKGLCMILWVSNPSSFLEASPTNFSLECPPNVVLNCDADLSNLDKYGIAYIWEHYKKRPAPKPIKVIYNTNSCGIGTITRTWEVEDSYWKWHICSQVITITGINSFTSADIIWPPYYELEGCNPNADPRYLPKPYNYPTFLNKKCAQPMYSYKDMKFTVADGCMKILREWKVIDWCTFKPNSYPQYGVYTYTQVIKLVVKDSTAYISCPKDTIVNANQSCYASYVKLDPAIAYSKCGIITTIRNTSPYADKPGPDASGLYPIGTTEFYFIAEYGCGREIKCKTKVTVLNKIPPTPYCLIGIIVALMPVDSNRDGIPEDGMVEIWAKDLDHNSFHQCGYKNLRFSFSSDPNNTFRVFTCKDLGKNTVEIWVTDAYGNQSFCKTTVEIQNNGARIPDCKRKDSVTTTTGSLVVNGSVLRPIGEGVKEAMVSLTDLSSFTIQFRYDTSIRTTYDTIVVPSGATFYIKKMDTSIITHSDTIAGQVALNKMSDDAGKYSFIDLKKDHKYKLIADKLAYDLKGIDINDVIFLIKVLLGSETLSTPYDHYAADINSDKIIDDADFDILYDLIQGLIKPSEIKNPWKIIPASYTFLNPLNPLIESVPEFIEIKSMQSKMDKLDFMAIKKGELNGSSLKINKNPSSEIRSGLIPVYVDDVWIESDKEYDIAINVQATIFGGELNLSSSNLEFTKNQHFKTIFQNQGRITFVNYPHTGSGPIMIRVKSGKSGQLSELLTLDSHSWLHTKQQQYVKLMYRNSKAIHAFELIDVYPNPFSKNQQVTFEFNLESAQEMLVDVSDLNGKILHMEQRYFEKGLHFWELKLPDNLEQGMLLYRLSCNGHSQLGKLIHAR